MICTSIALWIGTLATSQVMSPDNDLHFNRDHLPFYYYDNFSNVYCYDFWITINYFENLALYLF